MSNFIRCLAFIIASLFASTSLGAILITDTDSPPRLLGATNVDVNGILYDVSFQDGTCSELFNGCDQLSDFTFINESDATAAAQALMDQVLLDIIFPGTTFLNAYDTFPHLVAGCETASQFTGCHIMTPYGFISGEPVGMTARNFSNMNDDIFSEGFISISTFRSPLTYAVWTTSVIPLPAATWLFLSAFMSLLGVRHIKHKN